jgi:hypothetical protein
VCQTFKSDKYLNQFGVPALIDFNHDGLSHRSAIVVVSSLLLLDRVAICPGCELAKALDCVIIVFTLIKSVVLSVGAIRDGMRRQRGYRGVTGPVRGFDAFSNDFRSYKISFNFHSYRP